MQLMTQVIASTQIGCECPQRTKQLQISSMDQFVRRRSASSDTSYYGCLYMSSSKYSINRALHVRYTSTEHKIQHQHHNWHFII